MYCFGDVVCLLESNPDRAFRTECDFGIEHKPCIREQFNIPAPKDRAQRQRAFHQGESFSDATARANAKGEVCELVRFGVSQKPVRTELVWLREEARVAV